MASENPRQKYGRLNRSLRCSWRTSPRQFDCGTTTMPLSWLSGRAGTLTLRQVPLGRPFLRTARAIAFATLAA